MDKLEYQAKLEEINKLVEKKDYEAAAAIVDTIEWKRVRSVRTLCTVSEIYEALGRVEDSKAILYRAYRRTPNSRQILYRLTEVCIQTQDFDDAVEYYTEYVNLSPHDNSKYILKYELYKGRGSSVEEQIEVLEEYKSKEYTERWAYELARLYDEAGMIDHCVAECDDLALWFHNGKYVVAALELKQKYVPLTPEQQTVYDNPSEIVDMETKEKVVEEVVPTLDAEITKELPTSEKDVIADSIIMDTEKEIAAAVTEHKEEEQREEKPEAPTNVVLERPVVEPVEETPAVEVKEPKNFDTVGLQNELASSMRQILSGLKPAPAVEPLEVAPTVEPMPAPEAEPAVAQKAAPVEEMPEEPAAAPAPKKAAAPVVETTDIDDLLTAPTVDLSQKIRSEIGDKNLRDYAMEIAASKAAESAEEEFEEVPEEPTVEETAAEEPVEEEDDFYEDEDLDEEFDDEELDDEDLDDEEDLDEEFDEELEDEPFDETEEQVAEEEIKTAKDIKADPNTYVRNGLDETEKRLLGFWSHIRGMNEQIDYAVTMIMRSILTDKTSSSGNIVLVGDAGNGRTTLAISIAKIVSRCKGEAKAKVAKVYAEDFNKKDIAATVNKMAGGVLIIEEAGDLDDNAISQLSMAMDFKTNSLVVVLEDERRYLQDLMARNVQFAQKFNITINVPMLTNDELVEFAKFYAMEKDCVLDESAVQTLYYGIGAMQSPEQPVAILDVKDIVDKAIRHANRFGLGKLFSSISGKRYDAEDRVILKGKNFKKIK